VRAQRHAKFYDFSKVFTSSSQNYFISFQTFLRVSFTASNITNVKNREGSDGKAFKLNLCIQLQTFIFFIIFNNSKLFTLHQHHHQQRFSQKHQHHSHYDSLLLIILMIFIPTAFVVFSMDQK
jgi:hypothetical protein